MLCYCFIQTLGLANCLSVCVVSAYCIRCSAYGHWKWLFSASTSSSCCAARRIDQLRSTCYGAYIHHPPPTDYGAVVQLLQSIHYNYAFHPPRDINYVVSTTIHQWFPLQRRSTRVLLLLLLLEWYFLQQVIATRCSI